MYSVRSLLIILAALNGCDSKQANLPEMPRVASLSKVGSENAATIMRLIDQLCIRRSASGAAMAKGLAATGWQWEQIQSSDPEQPLSLDLWKSTSVQLIRGNIAGEDITNCTISVEGVAAPDPSLISHELSKLTKFPGRTNREWSWRSSASTQTHIELTNSAFGQKAGISVIVENYKLPWWRSILGI